ncbi:MAG: hypothetical protein E7650_02205 [Ruminococcaceae bacterium]|nr:hypothetical protein [Oscillospiraceae bacterium]
MNYYQYSYDRGEQFEQIRPFLMEGEQVLWLGKPYTSVRYRPSLPGLLFSLFFFSFSVFWISGAARASGFFALFGLPFLAFGAGMLYTTLFATGRRLKNTVYAVTDRRTLITVKTRRGTQCTAHFFSTLGYVSLCDVRGDSGTLLFRVPGESFAVNGTATRSITFSAPFAPNLHSGFLMIDGVQHVQQMIVQQIPHP